MGSVERREESYGRRKRGREGGRREVSRKRAMAETQRASEERRRDIEKQLSSKKLLKRNRVTKLNIDERRERREHARAKVGAMLGVVDKKRGLEKCFYNLPTIDEGMAEDSACSILVEHG